MKNNRIFSKCLSLSTTAILLLLLSGNLFAQKQLGLIHQWRFDRSHCKEKTLTPKVGGIKSAISGTYTFDPKVEALVFNGKNTYVKLDVDPKKNPYPKKQFSVEAWLQVRVYQKWGGIAGVVQHDGNKQKGWMLGSIEKQFSFGLATKATGKLTYLKSKTLFDPNTWYHVVGTYDGKKQRIYVDGRLTNESTVQSGEILYPDVKDSFYSLGAFHDTNELHRLSGTLGEVSIYNRALSKTEVTSKFEAIKLLIPEIAPIPKKIDGWPTYLHDNQRSGATVEKLQFPLSPVWEHHARHQPQPAWPAPAKQDFWNNKFNLKPRVIYDRAYHVIAVDGRGYYATSADDQMICFDLKTGKTLWRHFTEGPIRLAGTIENKKLYFGSDDGYVYCLDAISGKLIWKYDAAPKQWRVAGNERIISAFPIRSSVLVADGLVRFTSGLFPSEGTYQYALDAKTGKELAKGKTKISAQGYIQRKQNKLYVAEGRSPIRFVASLKRKGKVTNPALSELPVKYPYAFIAAGDTRIAGGDGEIAAFSATDGRVLWKAKVEGKAYSLAIADGSLLVSTDRGVIYCYRHLKLTEVGAKGNPSATKIREPVVKPVYPDRVTQHLYTQAADKILKHADLTKGYCLVVDSGEGFLAYELAKRSQLKIIGIDKDLAKIQRARKRLAQAGLYGQVVFHHWDKKQLPYSDMLMNLIVCDSSLTSGKQPENVGELTRLIAPKRGVMLLGSPDDYKGFLIAEDQSVEQWGKNPGVIWKEITGEGHWLATYRKPIEGIGEWTHMYANSANTVCSEDQHVAGKLRLQWFGRPGPRLMIDRHHRNVPPLSKNGRLFISGDNVVIAADIYNGTQLWQTSVPNSRRVAALRDSGNMVATDDAVYIVADDRCQVLSAKDGKIISSITIPKSEISQKQQWGYISVTDDIIVGTAVKSGASRTELSKKAIQEGSYWDKKTIVTSEYLFAMDTEKKQLQWKYQPKLGVIANPTITIAEGKIYFLESVEPESKKTSNGRVFPMQLWRSGAYIVSLDLKTGKELWRKPGSFRSIEHHLFFSLSKGKLVVTGSRNQQSELRDKKGNPISHVWYDIQTLNAANGRTLWFQSYNSFAAIGGEHGEQDKHQVIVGDTIYLEPFAFDLLTGKRLSHWNLRRNGHGCGAISASADSFFFRAKNPAICDLATGKINSITTISRPGCWINMLPVGGMLLIPEASSGCSCNFSLQTSMGFIPEKLLRSNQKPQAKQPAK